MVHVSCPKVTTPSPKSFSKSCLTMSGMERQKVAGIQGQSLGQEQRSGAHPLILQITTHLLGDHGLYSCSFILDFHQLFTSFPLPQIKSNLRSGLLQTYILGRFQEFPCPPRAQSTRGRPQPLSNFHHGNFILDALSACSSLHRFCPWWKQWGFNILCQNMVLYIALWFNRECILTYVIAANAMLVSKERNISRDF